MGVDAVGQRRGVQRALLSEDLEDAQLAGQGRRPEGRGAEDVQHDAGAAVQSEQHEPLEEVRDDGHGRSNR